MYAPELHRINLLTSIDLPMFEMFCSSYATWREYEQLASSKDAHEAIQLGYRGAADRAIEKAKSIAAMFGLEPKSRGGIKTIPVGFGQTPMKFEEPSTNERADQIRSDFRLVSKR